MKSLQIEVFNVKVDYRSGLDLCRDSIKISSFVSIVNIRVDQHYEIKMRILFTSI